MPELHFAIRWPDGSRELCYSPSTVIRDHFVPGTDYPLPVFLQLCRDALGSASDRVRERYGVPCSRAMGQLAAIERTAKRYAGAPDAGTDAIVQFEDFQS
jgi:uncharacterized repeat protein (TIGR04042 family)